MGGYGQAVTRKLAELGFPAEFAQIVGNELNTEFTSTWMLRYLAAAKPERMEDVADEMLEILSFRDRCVEKHRR